MFSNLLRISHFLIIFLFISCTIHFQKRHYFKGYYTKINSSKLLRKEALPVYLKKKDEKVNDEIKENLKNDRTLMANGVDSKYELLEKENAYNVITGELKKK